MHALSAQKIRSGTSSHLYAISNEENRVFGCSIVSDETTKTTEEQDNCIILDKPRWLKGVSFSPVGMKVVRNRIVVAFERAIHVWCGRTGVHLLAERRHKSKITCLEMEIRRGNYVVSADDLGCVMVWDPESGHALCVRDCETSVTAVSLFSDILVVGTSDGSIRIFDIKSRNIVRLEQNLHRDGSVTCLSIVEQQDRYLITSGGEDGIVWLIFVRKKKELYEEDDNDEKTKGFEDMHFVYVVVVLSLHSVQFHYTTLRHTHTHTLKQLQKTTSRT